MIAQTDIDQLKQAAAKKAVEQVESGMVVGLGTGSTSTFANITSTCSGWS